MEHSNLDRALHTLNWHGRYQLTQMALIYVSVLPGSLNILSYIFVGYDGPHSCTEITNTSLLGMYSDHVRNESSISYGECSIGIKTNTSQGLITEHLGCVAGNTYTEHKQVSIVSEWDLVCERASMSELTQTVFVLGQATGGLLCSSMSDRFGRKFTYIFNVFMLLVIGLVLSFSPNYAVFVTFRFLAGICQQGTDLTIATMILESVPTDKRFLGGTIGSMLWGTALVTLAPLAYFLRNVSWRYLQLAVALTAAYSVILPFTLDETLRWLEANGKTKEIDRILRKAAKANNVPTEEVLNAYHCPDLKTDSEGIGSNCLDSSVIVHQDNKCGREIPPKTSGQQEPNPVETGCDTGKLSLLQDDADSEDDRKVPESKNEVALSKEEVDEEMNGKVALIRDAGNGAVNGQPYQVKSKATKRYTLLDILRHKMIFMNAVVVWYCWIVDSLVYYGLYMTSSALAGNRYLNYFLNSAVEVPASLLIFLTLERYGRKIPSLYFHTTAGVSLLVAVLLKTFAGDYQAAMVISTILSLVGKLTISTAFGVMFIYTPELFPTNLRNAGLGAASTVSRLGGMLSPFAGTLEKKVAWAPGAIFAGMCLLAGFVIQFLPETRGHELPQTLEDIREWYRTNIPSKKQKGKQLKQSE